MKQRVGMTQARGRELGRLEYDGRLPISQVGQKRHVTSEPHQRPNDESKSYHVR